MKRAYLGSVWWLGVAYAHFNELLREARPLSKAGGPVQGYHDNGFEAHSEGNFSMFADDAMSESEVFGLGGLQARQGTCPPGYSPCGGNTCCRFGYTCVPGGCCPPGTNTKCGSTGCYNAATQVCCAADSTHCPRGRVCVQDGCCPQGQQQCGSSGCYDPKSETCCGTNSKACRKGQVCTPAGCCPAGYRQCGTRGCYNPRTQKCCPDSGTACRKDEDCVEGGKCCPEGEKPCGKDHCYNPKVQECCTDGTLDWGCPKSSSCCKDAKDCYYPLFQKCCDAGACPKGSECCGLMCCLNDSTCGDDGICTASSSSAAPTQTSDDDDDDDDDDSTATATVTATTATTTGCVTPTLNSPQTKTETIKFVYDPSRVVKPTDGPNAGKKIDATNQAVIMNICRGIDKFSGGGGGNLIMLTHGGKCFQKEHRKVMCETKGRTCKDGVNEYISSVFGTSTIPTWATAAITSAGDMSCDEFPFASSLEGGDTARGVTVCVPSDDNNWQGGTMSSFFNKRNKKYIRPGENYWVEVVGWNCDAGRPTKRDGEHLPLLSSRDAFTKGNGVNRSGDEMWHGFDTDNKNNNMMPMPLGDLSRGTYEMKLDIKKGNLDLLLVDHNGNTYDTETSTDGTLSFALEEDVAALGVIGVTEDEEVEVVYKARQLSHTVSTTANGGPEPTDSSDDDDDVAARSLINIGVLGVTVLFATAIVYIL